MWRESPSAFAFHDITRSRFCRLKSAGHTSDSDDAGKRVAIACSSSDRPFAIRVGEKDRKRERKRVRREGGYMYVRVCVREGVKIGGCVCVCLSSVVQVGLKRVLGVQSHSLKYATLENTVALLSFEQFFFRCETKNNEIVFFLFFCVCVCVCVSVCVRKAHRVG